MSHETFAGRVRVAMAARGLRNKDLAQALDTREDMVSLWVTGKRTPSLSYLEQMPRALCVNGHWLLTGEGTMEPAGEAGRKLELLEWAMGARAVSRLVDLAEAAQTEALAHYLSDTRGRTRRSSNDQ